MFYFKEKRKPCDVSFRYTFVDILRAILLSLESMIEDPELQVNGFILIIDWSNFTFKQASKLTPSMLRLAIEGLQVRSCMTKQRLIELLAGKRVQNKKEKLQLSSTDVAAVVVEV